MSNEALINKYRPRSFEEVIGQGPIVKSLRKAIDKRLGHTFLFVGPSGTGKTTLARLAAKAVGCAPATIHEIDAATNSTKDDVKEISEPMMYRPLGAEAKAIIVDEFHALSAAAVQALLKSTEEPPPWGYWFLCTTEAGKIPEALKTRALKYQLKPLPSSDLVPLLETIASHEKMTPAEGIIQLCAKYAGGSPRQAISNLGATFAAKDRATAAELLMAAGETAEAIEFVRALYRGAGWEELRGLIRGLPEGTSGEGVRQIVRAYGTKIVLDEKTKERNAGAALEILSEFSAPFYAPDGLTPVLLAVARLKLMEAR